MQELRLVGVDGEHLLLSGEEGTSYRLPVDDALRTATTRAGASTAPASQAPAGPVPEEPRRKPAKPPVHLTPRDIQARIRMGATAEQVSAESGLDLAHVERYEGPVRAERDYVAYLAQRVEVATPLPSHDGYRSAFGESPALLGDMVAFRVRSYGIDPSSLEWDSWRRQDGSWHVEAAFDLPDAGVDLGEQPPARWTYNPTRKTVTNGNRWAQVLSELEPLDGPLPARRLSAVADHVFDFEAEKADEVPEPAQADQDGLLDVLRSRRGQRLGADEDGDDALAELLSRGGIPAAHPRTDDAVHEDQDVQVAGLTLAPRAAEDTEDVLAAEPDSPHHEDGTPRLYDGVSTETREISVFAHPTRPQQPPVVAPPATGSRSTGARPAPGRAEDAGTEEKDAAKPVAEPAAERRPKPKRSSVPSWDDIVFGRKGD